MGDYATLMMDAQKAKRITGINTGLCERRAQERKPAFFINWKQDDEQKYFFSAQMFMIGAAENRLRSMQ